MPYADILCSWLVRSALVSLTILLIGSGAVLIWRQPAAAGADYRIGPGGLPDCTLAGNDSRLSATFGCLVARCGHTAAGSTFATAGEPMTEPAISEPMPFPIADRATPPVPSTKTSPNHRPCFRDSPLDRRHLPCWRGNRGWLVACGDCRAGTPLVDFAACPITLPGIAYRDFRWAWRSGSTLGKPPPEPAVCLCLGTSGDCPARKPLRR